MAVDTFAGTGTDAGALSGLGELRACARAGTLAERYPRVRPLLERLDDDALVLAGRLLARLSPAEVRAAHPGIETVRVAITGRCTLAELLPPLTAHLARHGLLLEPFVSGAGHYRDLTDPGSVLYAHRPDVTLCVLDPVTVWDQITPPWQPYDVALALERERQRLTEAAATHARRAPDGSTLVFNTVPLLRRFAHQLTGLDRRAELGGIWREAGAQLLYLADPAAGLAVLDLEPVLASGIRADDPRLGAYAQAHASPAFLAAYAREAARLIASLRGGVRKCLVLDLDGTLWDGTLAEDGPTGVSASGSARAEAFGAFQRTVKQLASQGVLLAVCSKNDPGEVEAALTAHPEFPLGADDFVAVSAGWGSKAEGIQKIAADLGISPSSVVFADDTPFEREVVRAGVPGAAVIPLDADPALHPERLLAGGWFDLPSVTEEDAARPARYRERGERESSRARTADYAAFLRGLGVRAEVRPVREPEAARLAQLSQRTNRFNLTGARLTTGQVLKHAAAPGALALAVRAADRFGDDGLIGAVFGRAGGDGLRLDNVLMSCRVLGRGIEEAVLAGLLHAARDAGHPAVTVHWRPTRYNAALPGWLAGLGFAAAGRDRYRHPLHDLPEVPAHVDLRLTLDPEGGTGCSASTC
ncbi:hypothetical protein SRB5_17810 [Streptomyces sp. RB5]|uniref:N-acetyltransferase domain-containing protein n=1 Tax=Streptomyces smaragdinus TaxID=2585196 RepID=A0A7K0CF45_9ACTN|nr:HAD-IIIC family phosphatase [Streptomyces smaragdinus]MQY11662.1 hypothetical protein [Streptomyces smaragdinus]